MTDKTPNIELYHPRGTIPQSGKLYITRKADDDLYRHLSRSELCYVLTARQMGKSSLMVRTMQRLKQAGIHTAIIDLSSGIAGDSLRNMDQFYVSFLKRLNRELRFRFDVAEWWQEQGTSESEAARFNRFLRDELLEAIPEPIVIFIDEIDSIRALKRKNFPTDDFFAVLRAMYNERATDTTYNRLNFALIGVARPSDLITDPQRTPFNIGTGIDLTYFNNDEAQAFSAGMGQTDTRAHEVLSWVLHWTGGHPYLSHRVVAELVEHPDLMQSRDQVDALIDRLYINANPVDINLKFVSDWLSRTPDLVAYLSQYYRIAYGIPIQDDAEDNEILNYLKLTGVVRPVNGFLQVSNRVYARFFDREWVGARLSERGLITIDDLEKRFERERAEAQQAAKKRPDPEPVKKAPANEEVAASVPDAGVQETKTETDRIAWDEDTPEWMRLLDIQDEKQEADTAVETRHPQQDDVWSVSMGEHAASSAVAESDTEADNLADSPGTGLDDWLNSVRDEFSEVLERDDEPEEVDYGAGEDETDMGRHETALQEHRRLGRFAARWREALIRAGLPLTIAEFAALHINSTVVGFTVSYFIVFPGDMVFAVISGAVGFFIPRLAVNTMSNTRLQSFERLLPNTLNLWVNALRSGYSVLQSIEAIAQDSPEPVKTEFALVIRDIQLGIEPNDAYDSLLWRMPSDNLDLVLTAVSIQRDVGGNLAEILDVIGLTIRERIRLAGEASLQQAAMFRYGLLLLGLLPILQFRLLGDYFANGNTPPGQIALILAYLLGAVALFSMGRANQGTTALYEELGQGGTATKRNGVDLLVGGVMLVLIAAAGVPVIYFIGYLMVWLASSSRAGLLITLAALLGTVTIGVLAIALLPSEGLLQAPVVGSIANISLTVVESETAQAIVRLALTIVLSFATLIVPSLLLTTVDLLRRRQPQKPEPRLIKYETLVSRSFAERVIRPLLGLFAGLLRALSPLLSRDEIELRLTRAGRPMSALLFYAQQVAMAGLLGMVGLLFSAIPNSLFVDPRIPLVLVMGWVGAMSVLLSLDARASKRRDNIEKALPDALDLLVIAVEAGLHFDSAVGKLYEKWDNELSLEFGRYLQEIQLGRPRRDAVRIMADRIDLEDFRNFSAALIQAEELGVSVSRILRVQADQLRIKRRQRLQKMVQQEVPLSTARLLLPLTFVLWVIAPIIGQMMG